MSQELLDCRLGISCFERPCCNWEICNETALSWGIPYRREEDGLYVLEAASRWEWGTEEENFLGIPARFLPVGEYYTGVDDVDSDITRRIEDRWFESGFAPAWSIKKEYCLEDYYRWNQYPGSEKYGEFKFFKQLRRETLLNLIG